MKESFLNEITRAEDIILGTLGFDTSIKLVTIEAVEDGFIGTALAEDGEEINFKNEFPLDDLDRWALNILLKAKNDK